MNQFKRHLSAPSSFAKIYIAGPIDVIKQTCRHWCKKNPSCVNVSETFFIYCGGEENGAIVEFLNYPKFSSTPKEIFFKAKALGFELKESTAQDSFLITTPDYTHWWSDREQKWTSSELVRSSL
jgi:hypothetical protein